MIPPKAIFFDLDATLLEGAGIAQGVAHACQQVALAQPLLNVEYLVEANREAFGIYWPEVEDKWTLGVLDGATVSLETWRRTLRACGCDDEALVMLAFEAFSRHVRESYSLFDDAQEVVHALSARLPLALITNGAADAQREKVQVTGIESLFSAIAISGELGSAKPDASIFRFALDKLNPRPEGIWHVGDSLPFDVAGANAAGLTSIWLNRVGRARGSEDPKPHLEIASLTDLLLLIDSLGGKAEQ